MSAATDPCALSNWDFSCSVYVDDEWHGDVRTDTPRRMYQYHLTGLQPGVAFDVTVRATAGFQYERQLPQQAQGQQAACDLQIVYCMCEGPSSAPLAVTSTAPPLSPELRVEAMTREGLQLTWTAPQQFGEACVCGYQLLMDGQPYGGMVPTDVTSACVKVSAT